VSSRRVINNVVGYQLFGGPYSLHLQSKLQMDPVTLTLSQRFDIFTEVKIRVQFLWVSTSCSFVVGY
jgi:hypothetical protein